MKNLLKQKRYSTEDELNAKVRDVLRDLSQNSLQHVYDKLVTLCQKFIKCNGR